ncbi:hypothetical protein [Draconibacterium halophilum]|uniref:Uncharacterized protein n=1 Tax=Draconibacterium halophilum TaxID=2706887 RepID=A0A6C0RAM2_9BACT|nr:hypothetical protein [Draconibacterium halophilum]QIA06805.1 hypothetical protein G0Q07_03235 [Draconibacterium halophilum]
MKTTHVFFGIIIFLLFVGPINAQTIQNQEGEAQELTLVRTNNSIRLNGSSETRELQVEVTEEGCYFNLDIDANVEKGSIKIEIYDPVEGKRVFSQPEQQRIKKLLLRLKQMIKVHKRKNVLNVLAERLCNEMHYRVYGL